MSSSPQEKELLKKRLKKLFQKQNVKSPIFSKTRKQPRIDIEENNFQNSISLKDQRVKESNAAVNGNKSKNNKTLRQSQKQSKAHLKPKSFESIAPGKSKKIWRIDMEASNIQNTKLKDEQVIESKTGVNSKQSKNNQEQSKAHLKTITSLTSGKSNKNIQQRNVIANNINNNTKIPKDQNVKKSIVGVNKNKSVNKNQTNSKSSLNENGCVKTPEKQIFDKNLENSKEHLLKKDKQKVFNLQKKKNLTAINTNEECGLTQESRQKSRQEKHKISNKRETTMLNESNLVANNKKVNENLTKKGEKRAAVAGTLNGDAVISKKKRKLITKKAEIRGQKHASNIDESSSSSQIEDQYAVNGMTGCVVGGDFDSDNAEDDMEHDYWMQDKSSSEDESEDNSIMQPYQKNSQTGLENYKKNELSDDEEEYSCSDDDDYNFYDSYEEEGENYSDFDEDDYEEDEECYNYYTDENDHSSNFYNDFHDNNYGEDEDCYNYSNFYDNEHDDMSYDFNDQDSDEDYELPKHIPEDLIIHRGTATKRNLEPEDNVTFNSEESQIVELENQQITKLIYQPKCYEREELLKLKYEGKYFSKLEFHKIKTSNNEENCPKLVPIVDEDGFQLYNPNEDDYKETEQELEESENKSYSMDDESLGSEYTEINSEDADSLLSEDIKDKYLNTSENDFSSNNSIDEIIWKKKFNTDVIDATGCKYENNLDISNNDSNISLIDDDISQIPSVKLYENVDAKTECSILSTTIVDSNLFSPNDGIEEDVCVKNNVTQKVLSKAAEVQQPEEINVVLQDGLMEKENGSEQSPKVAKSFGQSLANYQTKFFNAFNSNMVIVLLKDPFYIYGTVRLTLLAGTVEVYGHSLVTNTEVEIFSPRGCSVIEISPSKTKSNISTENLKEILKAYEEHFALRDLNKITNLFACETDAIVLLKRNDSRKKVVQQFKKFMNENVFPNINNINMDRPLYNSEYLLRCMINTSAQEQKCLRLPQQWQDISITSESRVMLAGGKGVGKSTLLRYLINRHLPQKVLLIDLDIGQPELFIPQTISCTIVKQPLLGPGFFLNMQPEISYAVGHSNIALCAHKYMAAVRSLVAYCKSQEEYKAIPWLINTMGYNKGFGLELISIIAQELSLTAVIQLQSNKDINNFDSILHPHVLSSVPRALFPEECADKEIIKEKLNYRLHVWQSAVEQKSRYQKEWEMSAKDLRFAMFLARLSEALQGNADWLTDVKPFSASLNKLKIVNLMDNTALSTAEQLTKTVEANLVYLCHYEEDSTPLKCLGIGVVRAVEFHVQQLYLIPALPENQLKNVNCVAIGEFTLPTSLFINQGPRVKNIAPFIYNTMSANASKAIKQIYHRPRKFLTGKHKPLD